MKNYFAILAILFCLVIIPVYSQNYPSGFSQVQIVNGISNPTVYDFAPDGRIFVCQQDGALRVIKNGMLLAAPAIELDVIMAGESGLVGIAVHPDFAVNKYVYLYYTTAIGTKRNKISRFTFSGDVINPASEILILELDPLTSANIHNGGCMKFTQDGKLMVSVGENNNSANSQNADSYLGKIIRINQDGSAPADNPFASGTTPQKKRVWAMGLRNPFTFDINPVNGKIFVNDVGHALWEEINDATTPGVNFGWPLDQGIVAGTTFTNPIFAYAHNGESITGCAITGGAFFNPSASNYPSTYLGKYFFVDYCSNFIRFIDPNVTNPVSSSFASSIPETSLSLKTGPDGQLYFLSRSTGALYKIIYSLNSTLTITDQPDDLTVAVTQNASFIVSVSGAPPFTYQWKRNGVNISGATSSAYAISNVAQSDSGKYSVVISNSSGSVISREAVLSVIATTPPVATIISPASGTFYSAGNVINFSGNGTDAEDGILPASAFTWKVEFLHGTGSHQHVHDGPPIAVGVKTGSFTIPDNNETATDVFYRLKLTVKDSKGISDTKSVDIFPNLSTISLTTLPAGFRVLLDGSPRNTVFSFQSVEGIERTLGVISPQVLDGVTYKFDHWSQGGSETQTINTPENNSTYTAIFKVDSDLRDPDNPSNIAAALKYNYYEGAWLVLPDFNSLTPAEIGTVATFSLAPKNRTENFAFKFTGYIDILEAGVYKFFTSSNDGSKLYIGDRLVVNNDGQHTNMEQAATIGLKAGKHSITVTYFQYNGSSNLLVSYSKDGLPKQEIPAARLFHSTGGIENNAPSVSINSPSTNQEFPSASSITISANASDGDGSINKVEFYQGAVKLGEDMIAPYQYLWNNVADGNYLLTAKAFDNQNASATSSSITIKVGNSVGNTCDATGTIIREYWTGISGQAVSSIPVTTSPNGTQILNVFEGPQNWENNYGTRIRGYICAPVTGNYYFWIASNDAGELWLSSDENPSNKVKVAFIDSYSNYREWTKMSTQKSVAINLVAGNKYYVEALHKEGVNSDHISIGWQLPNGTLERPIPGSYLSPYENNNVAPVVSISNPSNNQEFPSASAISITANATDSDGSISKVEFYQGAVKLGEDLTAPYQFSWNNVADGNYLLKVKAFDNQNASTVSSVVTIIVGGQSGNCSMQGTILREYWTGVSGQTVSNIPVHIAPSGTEQLTIFEGPQNWSNNYGSRISGYICPPFSGEYYFWISCNDGGELWLSTNENPENKVKIAFVSTYSNYREWTKMPSQKSVAINLVAGNNYYIEALQKEGVNSDHISVGWQLPDGTLERPIAGFRLSPYSNAEAKLTETIELTPQAIEDTTYKILVFPNPAEKGFITLGILGYRGKTKAGVVIMDLDGKEVYSEKVACDKTCARTLINIDERFSPGTYVVYVLIENKTYSEKLLIK